MTDGPAVRTAGTAGLREEWFLGVSIATSLIFLAFPEQLFRRLSEPLWFAVVFGWLFAVVLGSALSVVRHADRLAEQLREPYGTLILTLAITSIEVMAISAVMIHGENNPTLARDTLFAVVMIILNGMVGLSLLLGAWRRPEQQHNLQGANAYLGVIVPLATLSLVMPTFLAGPDGQHPSAPRQLMLGIVSVGLYATFLFLQAGRHHDYFTTDGNRHQHPGEHTPPHGPLWPHAVLLFAYMGPVVFLVEQLARPIDYIIETLHAPTAFGGVVMAILVATPEAISAVRASIADNLQRSVNIFLGSVLSTIGLTVPAMLVVSRLYGHPVTLGLEHSDLVMLVLTLAVSIITFASGRTHLMQGAVHLVLFLAYVLLIFQQ
ncbi:sodium/calcium antiporter protein [Rhizobium phaseoli]|uniref:Calcium:proton antiporter n=1 Tax=Rhizobium phaseoli TaxID=396 RepID=A0A192TFJ3_9HYPH|nr:MULTISPECIES: calcium:proton antiporter [Rhizobium]MDH6650931.1 Ca2+:H+ antiporter [Rhizobium esperanzae]ANL29693.1 sodium/calcium antiporter protein [Rhizobium phaseoli]ANL42259.1 sodium/calcium antiporter protein [Rhizobium phaseoli]ANL54969.1 sodium/calcium antiporter protein [Rhizobium phaseoli]ANL61246.1 sodium/calcium antiporter protein [Rhizobium phaseoli]